MQVIPPGMDFSNVVVQEDTTDADGDLKELTGLEGTSPRAVPPIWSEVNYFLMIPISFNLPIYLAIPLTSRSLFHR